MDHCHNCDQELFEIDNRGQRLVGCLTCNLWAAEGDEGWTLSEEDLAALHGWKLVYMHGVGVSENGRQVGKEATRAQVRS